MAEEKKDNKKNQKNKKKTGKKFNKRKFSAWVQKHINAEAIKLVILFIPMAVLLVKNIASGKFELKGFFDTGVLVSFVFVFICESISKLLNTVIQRNAEDANKLDEDYQDLVKRYCVEKPNMVTFWNAKEEEMVYFPELLLCQRKIKSEPFFDIAVEEVKNGSSVKRYSLPGQIASNSEKIMEAHKYSVVYNNLNIRLEGLEEKEGKLVLQYSFTTYFDSLITNRAMDFLFRKGKTIREVYEPGPVINSLSESKMSNHLGFNGFVELRDGKIIFVHRDKNLSIGKKTWSQGVSASLKTKYCLDDKKLLSVSGLSNAIQKEIRDELKIDVSGEIDFTQSIFAFYRDLVEGGKPQFLFYYKVDKYDSEEFREHFLQVMREKAAREENNKKKIVDGSVFKFFTIEELGRCTYEIDTMIDDTGRKYRMMPSIVASTLIFLECMGKKN